MPKCHCHYLYITLLFKFSRKYSNNKCVKLLVEESKNFKGFLFFLANTAKFIECIS